MIGYAYHTQTHGTCDDTTCPRLRNSDDTSTLEYIHTPSIIIIYTEYEDVFEEVLYDERNDEILKVLSRFVEVKEWRKPWNIVQKMAEIEANPPQFTRKVPQFIHNHRRNRSVSRRKRRF